MEYGHQNTTTQLRNYLQQPNRGSTCIIVAVTSDEPSRYLTSALPILREMGADVADVRTRGSFGFVAQKGFLAKTVLRKALTEAESKASQPQLNATVTGVSYC